MTQQLSSCPKCRALLPYGTALCPYCGYQLFTPAASTDQTPLENTSGQGKTAIIPPEITGWNWGAFLLGPIWGIFNQVWISLLILIPIPLLGLIFSIILGMKGNEWAWQNKKWESTKQFHETQRKWMLWGIAISALSLLLLFILDFKPISELFSY